MAVKMVTLITRVNCHLCEEAKAILERVMPDSGADWSQIDVDTDPEMRAEYGDQVPVILIDGQMHSYFRLDEARLRQALCSL